jgi:hypothetical protein
MRVLLRQIRTKLYYDGSHRWTADAGGAFDFEDVERAITLGRDANLIEVEVVLACEDPMCDLVLPLPAGQ